MSQVIFTLCSRSWGEILQLFILGEADPSFISNRDQLKRSSHVLEWSASWSWKICQIYQRIPINEKKVLKVFAFWNLTYFEEWEPLQFSIDPLFFWRSSHNKGLPSQVRIFTRGFSWGPAAGSSWMIHWSFPTLLSLSPCWPLIYLLSQCRSWSIDDLLHPGSPGPGSPLSLPHCSGRIVSPKSHDSFRASSFFQPELLSSTDRDGA